jgi:ABC-type molybdate transport system substrate-binding protein
MSITQLTRRYSLPEDFEHKVVAAVEKLRDAQVELMKLALEAVESSQVDYFASLVGVSRATTINWAVAYKVFGDSITPDIPIYAYVTAALASGGDKELAEQLLGEIAERGVTAWLSDKGVSPCYRGAGRLIVGSDFFGVAVPPQPWMENGMPVRVSIKATDDADEKGG